MEVCVCVGGGGVRKFVLMFLGHDAVFCRDLTKNAQRFAEL